MHYTTAGIRRELAGQLPHERIVIPMWLSDYLSACLDELDRFPVTDTVTKPAFYVKYLREAMACPFLCSFIPLLKSKIEEELDKVSLRRRALRNQ